MIEYYTTKTPKRKPLFPLLRVFLPGTHDFSPVLLYTPRKLCYTKWNYEYMSIRSKL